MKICNRCLTEYDVIPGNFHVQKGMKDGYRSVCAACICAEHKENYAKDIEVSRAIERERYAARTATERAANADAKEQAHRDWLARIGKRP